MHTTYPPNKSKVPSLTMDQRNYWGIKVGEGDEGGGGPRGKDVKGGEDPEMVEEEG